MNHSQEKIEQEELQKDVIQDEDMQDEVMQEEADDAVEERSPTLIERIDQMLPSATSIATTMTAVGLKLGPPSPLDVHERITYNVLGHKELTADFLITFAKYIDTQRQGLVPGRAEAEKKMLKKLKTTKRIIDAVTKGDYSKLAEQAVTALLIDLKEAVW